MPLKRQKRKKVRKGLPFSLPEGNDKITAMKNIAILFDQDGTLTDSGPGIIRCAKNALQRLGIERSDKELRVFVGPPLKDCFLNQGVKEEDLDKAIAYYREEYETIGLFENRPYDGIPEMLDTLKKAGYPLFVVTSKDNSIALRILEHYDLLKYFLKVYGSNRNQRIPQSKQDLIRKCLLEENLKPEDTYMIGDTKYDILGAKGEKVHSIAVFWGYGSKESLIDSRPDRTVKEVKELENLLLSLGSDYQNREKESQNM